MKLPVDLVSLRDRSVHSPIVKASSAQRAFRAVPAIRTAVLGQVIDFGGVHILAPLPNVAGHVVKADLIRSLQCFLLWNHPSMNSCLIFSFFISYDKGFACQ